MKLLSINVHFGYFIKSSRITESFTQNSPITDEPIIFNNQDLKIEIITKQLLTILNH